MMMIMKVLSCNESSVSVKTPSLDFEVFPGPVEIQSVFSCKKLEWITFYKIQVQCIYII